jgi:hypothetical protein
MGTGVGEAALAAEAFGAVEAAGAVAGGAGIADAAFLGGEFAGGLGLTGGLAEGLGSSALLGGEYAGGLGSLAPAFQTAIGQTGAVMPEVAAQTAQFANVGAMPTAGTPLGAGQIGDPALAQQFGSGIANANPAAPMYEMNAAETADVMKNVDPRMVQGYMPDATNAADMTKNATEAANWANMPAPTTTEFANADLMDPSRFGGEGAAWDAATAGGGEYGGPAATSASKFPFSNPLSSIYNVWKDQDPLTKGVTGGIGALQVAKYLNKPQGVAAPEKYNGPLSKFTYSPDTYKPYTYKPYAAGGPVEQMSNQNAIGANTGFPQADIQHGAYATPWQTPISRNVVSDAGDTGVDQMTGMERMAEGGSASSDDSGDTGIAALGPMMYSPSMMSSSLVDPAEAYAASQPSIDMSRQNFQNFLAQYQNLPVTEAAPAPVTYTGLYAGSGPKAPEQESLVDPYAFAQTGFATGGIANLGGYSDGGRLLKGPGDGMSDNIPANISGKQPARLADGEFVVPADVVSGLGNGSTDAGAKQLYKMLDKVRSARTGNKKQGKQIKPEKYMPA